MARPKVTRGFRERSRAPMRIHCSFHLKNLLVGPIERVQEACVSLTIFMIN